MGKKEKEVTLSELAELIQSQQKDFLIRVEQGEGENSGGNAKTISA